MMEPGSSQQSPVPGPEETGRNQMQKALSNHQENILFGFGCIPGDIPALRGHGTEQPGQGDPALSSC